MASLEILPMEGALGAEIHGVDVTNVSDSDFATIRQAFLDYGVIFFRDQKMTPEQHLTFAERWGEINVNRFFTPVHGHPRIAEVRKEPEQKINVGGGWHTDHSYDEVPAMGSILYAKEVPTSGGDTQYASMGAAFDALSSGFKAMLEGLSARHSSRHVFGPNAKRPAEINDRFHNADQATQDVTHPVVIRHPDTGRKILYVNPGFTIGIEGWSDEESRALLEFLFRHATKPEFAVRFQWRNGSIAFWDNRATWHYALNDYHGERRLMHRITLEGVPLPN